jgi:competence protein ComEC
VVAHHGAGGSTSAGFLAAVAPRLALISVGYRNRFGHPHPDVIERLSASGARVLRTDRDGALLLGIDAGGVQVRAWREASRRYWRERPSSAQPDRPAGSSATER